MKEFLKKKEYIITGIVVFLLLVYVLFPNAVKYYIYDAFHTSNKYYFDAGVSYVEKGKIKYAEGSFKRALRFKGNIFSVDKKDAAQLEALFNLGVLNYKYYKNYSKAVFYFNKYLALFPNSPHKDEIYKVINFILSQDDSTKNIKAKELKAKGNDAFFRKNYKEALKYYEQANQLDPSYVEVYNNIATVYFAMKEFDKAIEYWKACLLFTPDDVSLYINIALAYETELKKYREAVKYYKMFLDKAAPDDSRRKLVEQKIEYINKNLL